MRKIFTFVAAMACTLSLYSQGVAFSWQWLRMSYPSDYVITDKEFDGESYNFCCEINNDDISMINFSLIKDALFTVLNKEEMIEVSMEGIDGIASDMRKQYTNLTLGETKVNRNHRYACVYRTFTGKLFGILIYGKIVVLAHGDKYACLILQAETKSYMNELNEIVNTVRLD